MNTSIYLTPDYLQAATEIRESRSFSSEIFVIASSKDPARITVSWQSDAPNMRPYERVVARFHRASMRGGEWTEERLIEEVAVETVTEVARALTAAIQAQIDREGADNLNAEVYAQFDRLRALLASEGAQGREWVSCVGRGLLESAASNG